jgi:hypothetical protein
VFMTCSEGESVGMSVLRCYAERCDESIPKRLGADTLTLERWVRDGMLGVDMLGKVRLRRRLRGSTSTGSLPYLNVMS